MAELYDSSTHVALIHLLAVLEEWTDDEWTARRDAAIAHYLSPEHAAEAEEGPAGARVGAEPLVTGRAAESTRPSRSAHGEGRHLAAGCSHAACDGMVHVEVLPLAESPDRPDVVLREPAQRECHVRGMVEVVDDVGR